MKLLFDFGLLVILLFTIIYLAWGTSQLRLALNFPSNRNSFYPTTIRHGEILCTAIPPGRPYNEVEADAKQCIEWANMCVPFVSKMRSWCNTLSDIEVIVHGNATIVSATKGTADLDFCVGNSLRAAGVPEIAVITQIPINAEKLSPISDNDDDQIWLELHGARRDHKTTFTRLSCNNTLEIRLGDLIVLKLDDDVREIYLKAAKDIPLDSNFGIENELFSRKVRVFGGLTTDNGILKIVTFRGQENKLERGPRSVETNRLLSFVAGVQDFKDWQKHVEDY